MNTSQKYDLNAKRAGTTNTYPSTFHQCTIEVLFMNAVTVPKSHTKAYTEGWKAFLSGLETTLPCNHTPKQTHYWQLGFNAAKEAFTLYPSTEVL